MSEKLRFLYSGIAFSLFGLGISLQIKANIGFSALDSFIIAVSYLSRMQIGTGTIVFSFLMSLIYILLSGRKSIKRGLIEFLMSILMGMTINFLGILLKDIVIDGYEIVFMFVGIQIVSISVAAMLQFNLFASPFESLINYIAQRLSIAYLILRWGMDVVMILAAVFIHSVFVVPVPLGKGTLLSIAVYTLSVQLYRKVIYSKKRRLAKDQNDYEI